LSLRIYLSKARAGTMRRSTLTRPAVEPAVYRSFGLGSVAAATIDLATMAGLSPPSFEISGVSGPDVVLHPPPPRGHVERGERGRQVHEDPE
jgi:hypothetical protein